MALCARLCAMPSSKTLLALAVTSVLVPACSSSAPEGPPCPPGVACTSFGAGVDEQTIQDAFATATDGELLLFGAGTFELTNTLTVAANNVTIQGQGMDQTILDFKGQKAGSEGVFAQSVQNITLDSFTVRDTTGNAVKILGATGVIIRKVHATWTSDDAASHGGYGLYPVQSKNVLVEDSIADGASDSGIYLGQSQNAVLRRNEVHDNVAGLEVENTYDADVYENNAHDNTGGILVFDLPGLPQLGGHGVRVYSNQIVSNNTDNFAAPGNTVGLVPRGTGFLVMANSQVEVYGNTFKDNATGNSAILSYFVTQQDIKDPNYYPYPSQIYFHDNTYSGGGTAPDAKKQMGILLSTALPKFAGNVVPNLIWDGIVDSAKTDPNNPMQICIHNNGPDSFADLHFDKLDTNAPDLGAILTTDSTNYQCTLPSLPPVSFPGLN